MKSIFKELDIKEYIYFTIKPYLVATQWFAPTLETKFGVNEKKLEIIEKSHTIYTTELDLPLMEKRDKFYIEKLDKIVQILDVVRSDGCYVYIVSHNISQDEESFRQYEIDKQNFLDKIEFEKEIISLKNKISKFQDSKYYSKFLRYAKRNNIKI